MNTHLTHFESHRPLLHAIAYRMLGSASEAEDVLQEAYLRFGRADLEAVDSPRAYLSAIVTRLCLNELTSARTRREVYPGQWLPEPVLSADLPAPVQPERRTELNESISMAFLVLLEALTPSERAVFILREVFDFEYAEIATILEKTEPACRKLFSRAKSYLAAHRPRFEAAPEEHLQLLRAFMRAAGEGDLEGLTTLLAEDVIFQADGGGKARGAALETVRGRENVARFVIGVTRKLTPQDARFEVAEVNGRPALLIRYPDGAPAMVVGLEVGERGIEQVWVAANPDKLGGV